MPFLVNIGLLNMVSLLKAWLPETCFLEQGKFCIKRIGEGSEAPSEPFQTCNMEHFAKIVNVFMSLTVFANASS